MISTGYFARTKDYVSAGMFPVSVALKTPAFFKYPKWTGFAPPKEMFWKWKKGEITNEEYNSLYKKFLESTVSQKTLENIKVIMSKKEIVLCCYEKPSDFCHRHALAEWLSKKLHTLSGEVTIVYKKNNLLDTTISCQSYRK